MNWPLQSLEYFVIYSVLSAAIGIILWAGGYVAGNQMPYEIERNDTLGDAKFVWNKLLFCMVLSLIGVLMAGQAVLK